MKKYKIICNGKTWDAEASSIRVAVNKVIKAEQKRLKERSQEIGKRLTLNKLEIFWRKEE